MASKTENLGLDPEELIQNQSLEHQVFREDYVCMHINMELGHLGKIKYITKNCYKLFGYTNDELLKANVKKIIGRDN